MKLVIYARVSTKEQAEEGYSLDAQVELCQKWAAEQGHEIVHVFIERGKSGRTDKRPMFQRAINFILADGAEGMVVHKSDRFARNLLDGLNYRKIFTDQNKKMFSVAEGLLNDGDDPSNKLIFAMVGAISEYVSDNIGREVQKGRAQKAKSGSWPYGSLPFGYTWASKSIVFEQPFAGFVAQAFAEFATGDYTLRTWADKAADLGITNATGQKIRATTWGAIFRKVFYTGRFAWQDEIILGDHLPVVDIDTFEEVQSLLDMRDSGGAATRHFWLLAGLVWLEGSLLQGSLAKGKYSYYRLGEFYIKAGDIEAKVESLLERVKGVSPNVTDYLKLAMQVAPNMASIYRFLLSKKSKRDFLLLVFKELWVNQGGGIEKVVLNDGFSFCD